MSFREVCAGLRDLPARDRVAAIERYRRKLDAMEAETLATGVVGPPHIKGGARGAFRMAEAAGVSTAEQRRRVNRARMVAENPAIAGRMAGGALGVEQVDSIARASRRTDGAAAQCPRLLDEIAAAKADQANRIADAWVEDHLTAEQVRTEHERQRGLRAARKGRSPDGLASITITGDDESIDIAWRGIQQRADAMYRADGGRDVAASDHPRTPAQRTFDAAIEFLTGDGGGSRNARPTVVVTARLDERGTWSDPALVGTGPIPASTFERFRCDAQMVALVADAAGQPLWLGRTVRTVSSPQLTALVARDRGCVLCGADHGRCEAHHVLPYSAPGRGRTDIDNLTLLCPSCHRLVHERRQSLIRGPDGRWSTRPATPDEVAPSRRGRPPDTS
ncbi:MAG: HNH endonuclease [Actinomycetota bacterium]